jgi:hypothetical protein
VLSPNDGTLRLQIAYDQISADARLGVRLGRHFPDLGIFGHHMLQMITPWLALYIHESRPTLEAIHPALHVEMESHIIDTFERIRHSTKLFLDRERPISGYEQIFSAIALEHKKHHIDRVLRPLRRWAKDLGLYSYETEIVMSTHGISFSLGMDPQDIHDRALQTKLAAQWREGGAALAMAALATEGPVPPFATQWDANKFSSTDVVAETYYSATFAGYKYPGLNATLLHYTAMCNSVRLLLPIPLAAYPHYQGDLYALFKIRYLLAYHTLASLKLLDQERRPYDAISQRHLQHLIQKAPGKSSFNGTWLRNTLVHYLPHQKASTEEYDGELLLGSIAAMTGHPDLDVLIENTNALLNHLSYGLNAWMHRDRFVPR